MRQTVGILGTPIDILDTEDVLRRLEEFIVQGRFHQVATANTDFLINACSDPELRHILRNADLVVPDGMPVVWAARAMRSRLPERVTGADVVPALAKLAANKGYRLFMLGAKPEIAQQAKAHMEEANPGIQIVGCYSPPAASLAEMNNDDILERIAQARPDILLVAFGNPKQEKWIYLHRERLREVPVCIGVGGTFDFLAGNTRRAPLWMQKSGMEWFHRLAHEPRRLWKRYFRDIVQFSRYLTKQWWALRTGRVRGVSDMAVADLDECAVLSVLGDFTKDILPRFQMVANEALENDRHLVLDFSGMTSFDGEALGTLINLSKRAAHRGREVRLVALPAAIRTALRRSQLHDGLFVIAESVAQAFTNSRPVGLSWKVERGKGAAVVTVGGASEPRTAQGLATTCARLLLAGDRVDLDARSLIYADSYLLTALHRLNCDAQPEGASLEKARFRIVPGETLRRVLELERLTGKFVLRDVPEAPQDAVVENIDLTELPSVEPTAAIARGA